MCGQSGTDARAGDVVVGQKPHATRSGGEQVQRASIRIAAIVGNRPRSTGDETLAASVRRAALIVLIAAIPFQSVPDQLLDGGDEARSLPKWPAAGPETRRGV